MSWVPFPGGPGFRAVGTDGFADARPAWDETADPPERNPLIQRYPRGEDRNQRFVWCARPRESPASLEVRLDGGRDYALAGGEYIGFALPILAGPGGASFFYNMSSAFREEIVSDVESKVDVHIRKVLYRLREVPIVDPPADRPAVNLTEVEVVDYVDGPGFRTTLVQEEPRPVTSVVATSGDIPAFHAVGLEIAGRSTHRVLTPGEVLTSPEGKQGRWTCVRSRWSAFRRALSDWLRDLTVSTHSVGEQVKVAEMRAAVDALDTTHPIPQLYPDGDWEHDPGIQSIVDQTPYSVTWSGRDLFRDDMSISLRSTSVRSKVIGLREQFGPQSLGRTEYARDWYEVIQRASRDGSTTAEYLANLNHYIQAIIDLRTTRKDILARETVCLENDIIAGDPAWLGPNFEVRLSMERLLGTDQYLWTEI